MPGQGIPTPVPSPREGAGLFVWLVKGETHPRFLPKGGVTGLFVWLVKGDPPRPLPKGGVIGHRVVVENG